MDEFSKHSVELNIYVGERIHTAQHRFYKGSKPTKQNNILWIQTDMVKLRKRQENSQREIKGRAGDEIRHTGVIVSE